MAEYIANEYLSKETALWIAALTKAPEETKERLTNWTAADVQPVKRGKWLQHGKADDYFWCCSACKKWIIYAEHDLYKHHYCGNCGAKMDGDDSAKG